MKTRSREQMKGAAMLLTLVAVVALMFAGCGGGGGGSAPAAALSDSINIDTGTISGLLESEDTGMAARAVSGAVMKPAAGARVYCHPKGTPVAQMVPDSKRPFAVTNERGEFTISSVPRGRHVLVVDVDADGTADRFIPNVEVTERGPTDIGKKSVHELDTQAPDDDEPVDNDDDIDVPVVDGRDEDKDEPGKKDSYCNVSLDRVIYATGDTLIMTFEGYNGTSEAMKCGVMINLRKGQDHPEQWRSDFEDASTFITIPANSFGSGVVLKVIPEEWALTNSPQGSDYHVDTINESGAEIGRGDNFNILKEKDCKNKKHCDDDPEPTPVCFSNADCDDNNAQTIDVCVNPGAADAACAYTAVPPEPEPAPACFEDAECNDNNAQTIDVCVNPGAADAACSYTAVPPEPEPAPACFEDAECNDNNAQTMDVCVNPGAADAACSYTAVPPEPEPAPACFEDAECNDNNAQTIDVCVNPGAAAAACSYTDIPPAPDPICFEDAECSDGDSNTVDACANPGEPDAVCTHTKIIACFTNADCEDNDPATWMFCMYPGTVNAMCVDSSLY